MPKPSRDRVRKWREKKAKKGGRSLSTWLEPETVQMMDYLLKFYSESAAPLVARAIATLYKVTRNKQDPLFPAAGDSRVSAAQIPETDIAIQESLVAPPSFEEQSPEVELTSQAESGASKRDPQLEEIKARIAAGIPFKELQKTLLVQWIKSMRAQNVSFREMAEILNASQIPTPTGMGEWEQGMIPTVLLLSSF